MSHERVAFRSSAVLLAIMILGGCAGNPAPEPRTTAAVASSPASPPLAPAPSSAPASPPAPRGPLDAAVLAAATGAKPEITDDVVKVSFPRDDVPVTIDGWKAPPFMGLTSWAGFARGEKEGVEAMVMGDLVLFEDEVSAAMSAALDAGLDVTALHNHFFFEKPHVYFMHIGGEGSAERLGKGVKATLDAQRAIRKRSAQPAATFGLAPLPGTSTIDGAKLDGVLGVKGQAKDGMYKAVMGRKTKAACGCTVGKVMGVNTWAAFAGSNDNAVVDGDFAVAESELRPVLVSLRQAGIDVVAIHSHMTQESPRILFLHYWGRGKAADLAGAVKKALDLTAWDGRAPTT